MIRENQSNFVVGGDGLLGKALIAELASRGFQTAWTSRRNDQHEASYILDLSKPLDRTALPACSGPVYLCAAVTSMDSCTNDPCGTSIVNVQSQIALAQWARESGAFVVFLSSNVVLPGTIQLQPIDLAPSPVNEYGHQKLEVERFLLTQPNSAIIRLTKVFSPDNPLLRGWAQTLLRGQPVQAFADRFVAPLPLPLVSRVIADLGQRRLSGLHHFSPTSDITYADLARRMCVKLGVSEDLVHCITAEQNPKLGFSSLDCAELTSALGIESPDPFAAIDWWVDSYTEQFASNA